MNEGDQGGWLPGPVRSFVNSGPIFRSYINQEVGPYSVGRLTQEARRLAQFCFEQMSRAGLWQYKARQVLDGYSAALEVSVIAVPNGAPLVRAWIRAEAHLKEEFELNRLRYALVPVFYFANGEDRYVIYIFGKTIKISDPPLTCQLPANCSAASDASNDLFFFWCGKRRDDVVAYERSSNTVYGQGGVKVALAPEPYPPRAVSKHNGSAILTYYDYEDAYNAVMELYRLADTWENIGRFALDSVDADYVIWNVSGTKAVVIQSSISPKDYGWITIDGGVASFSNEQAEETEEPDSWGDNSFTQFAFGVPFRSNPICIDYTPCTVVSGVNTPNELGSWYMSGANACCYTESESRLVREQESRSESYTNLDRRKTSVAGFFDDDVVQVESYYSFRETRISDIVYRPQRTVKQYNFNPEETIRMVCLMFDSWDLTNQYVVDPWHRTTKTYDEARKIESIKMKRVSGNGEENGTESTHEFDANYSVSATLSENQEGSEREATGTLSHKKGETVSFFHAATGIKVLRLYSANTEVSSGESIIFNPFIGVPVRLNESYIEDRIVFHDNSAIREIGYIRIRELSHTQDLCVFLRYTVDGGEEKCGVFRSDIGFVDLSQSDRVSGGSGFFPLVSDSRMPVSF